MNFVYQSFKNKIFFGEGQLEKINHIISEMGGTRLFVTTGDRNMAIVRELARSFGEKNVFHYSRVLQHVPQEIADEAAMLARENQSNILVAIGGGSSIGLAKAIALQNPVPILAAPTTYAGSEMTNIYGIRSRGIKTVGRNNAVQPRAVIYDPSLTRSMPLPLAATSSMNAMAHLVEALYAADGNPITYQLSLLGVQSLTRGMEQLIAEGSLANANDHLQFGSYLAGKALGEVSMALHHKLAHVLGGSFNMDHSTTHTVLLPHVLQCQMNGLSAQVIGDLKAALHDISPPHKIKKMAERMGAPVSLQAIGFKKENIPEVVRIMSKATFANPVVVDDRLIQDLLIGAYEGILK